MSPDARALVRLGAEIRRDLAAAKERLVGLEQRRMRLHGDGAELASYVALALHAYYTAIETICERISRTFDGGLPSGDRSHQELLEAMTLELPGIRPAVLGEVTMDRLRELLGFRHFVRHAYAVSWRLERLAELTDLAIAAHAQVEVEVNAFLEFLEFLSSA